MKKIFYFNQENKHRDRALESIKYDVRRYIKRERKKKLPDEESYWDFDCRFGQNSDAAETLKSSEVIAALESAHNAGWDHCYVEIIVKQVMKTKIASDELPGE